MPHVKPPPTRESYRWMYAAMGELHQQLYLASITGFTTDPVLAMQEEKVFLDIAEWVLDNGPFG